MNQQTPSKLLSHLAILIVGIFCSYAVGKAAASDITPGELLIRLTPDASADLQNLHNKSPIAVLFSKYSVQSQKPVFPHSRTISNPSDNLNRTFLLRFSVSANLPELKAAFEGSDLIEVVSYNYLRPTLADETVPNDPKYEEQWSLPLIKMPQAWYIEKGNRDVVIAIVDSGIDYRHDDLAQKIWVNPGEIPENDIDDDGNGYIDDVHGWDFTDAPNLQAEGDFLEGDNEPIDESGHGTHVAGIAGAMPNNGIGIAGVAWNSSLMAVRAGLSVGGGSRMQDDDSAAAIVYATDNGASIINMSWGSAQHSFIIEDAINYAYANGVVLIGAAGNSQEGTSIFPAGYRKVISVASTNQHRQRFYKSNFGASVDIGAPGNAILSTQIGNTYRILTGTSMAAPHIAGVAALMLSKRSILTHDEVRQILVNTSDVVLQEDNDDPDPKLVGAGTLNAQRALLASSALQSRIIFPETNSGGSTSITFVGTTGGYKFASWQMSYGRSTVPNTFNPITEPITTQKVAEQLVVWDTSNIPEDTYTVRLVVTGRDGSQTHDQVILTVDRSPPQIHAINAIETIYGDNSSVIFSWLTDDVSRSTFYYRRRGNIAPFASIEEREIGKEHLFSLGFTAGVYQFYISAENNIGLNTVNDNNGNYYTIDVTGTSIPPNGYIEKDLGIPLLHLANNIADFDKDGLFELIGSLPESSVNDPTTSQGLVIYERLPTGKYKLEHSSSDIAEVADTTVDLNQNIDLESFIPWAVGDTDNDGLQEILANDKDRTFLIESLTPKDFPVQIIWETPFISGGKIADLDGDGMMEIVGIDNSNNRILIFENRGNNLYERTAALVNETEGKNVISLNMAIGDFNLDGNIELVVGDSEGELFFYSATANDNYHLQLKTKTNIDDVKQLISGDLTGDGKPELVVGGIVYPPEISSVSPIWKFVVLTYKSGKYIELWEQNISPYRLNGNSLGIAELNGDLNNELLIITYPNIYIFQWDGITFVPSYHQKVAETSSLFTGDINGNGFQEFYVNLDGGLSMIESTLAKDSNSVDALIPWNVTATPLTSKIVQVSWESLEETDASSEFTIYRAEGEKQEAPNESKFNILAMNLSSNRFLDRTVKTGTTYWYGVTSKGEKGIETKRSDTVSATPRTPPKVISSSYQSPNWITVTFDRQMNSTISDERRYNLRIHQQLGGIHPVSAIRDRMGTRVLLAFDTKRLQSLISIPTNQYEIAVTNLADIDENAIRAGISPVEIQLNADDIEIDSLTELRVYPNPIRPNGSDKGAITFDRVPIGTRIQLFTTKGDLLEELQVSENDGNSKDWWLTNGSIGDISAGIYIYILEYEEYKTVGKIAVIK